MTQVLSRATEVLDALAARPLWRLGELAGHLGLAPSTAARLLAAMVELDWADQVAPRGAYRLGPRAHMLAERYATVEPLLRAARPRLAEIVGALAQPAVLVRLRGDKRQVLLLRAPQSMEPEALPAEDRDLYQTATGRLLLAHLGARGRRRMIDGLGLPAADDWPGIIDRRELEEELRQLRRDRYLVHETPQWYSHAAWVGRWNGQGACIGTFAPPGRLHPATESVLRKAQAELMKLAT
jgi:DNA-binding IclR family transcriptional regulator